MAELRLENVTKTYPGGIRAVDRLSLTVADGEWMVLVGPSGCGKSTTLRMVAGLEDVSAGTIRIEGSVVNGLAPRDRDVAMVFQDHVLYPHLTVRDNLAFGLRLRGVGSVEIAARAGEAAKLLGIEELLDRRPGSLSGGQRQRVALGRAIVRHPRVLLLDEPLSNLEPSLRAEMRTRLKTVHRQVGTTTVFVTHDQREALAVGDRVAVMQAGRIAQCGSADEVYGRPVNRFVAGFLGDPPMSFIEGRLVSDEGDVRFESTGLQLRLGDRLAGSLRGRAGQEVVLGIRPEWMAPVVAGESAGGEEHLTVTVYRVEPLGDTMQAYGRTVGGDRIVCRVEADRAPAEGARWVVHVNTEQVHVFASGGEGVNVSLTESGEPASAA